MTLFLVLFTIVSFLLVDLLYQKIKTRKTIFDTNYSNIKNLRSFSYSNLLIPRNHFYSQGHTSFRISESGNLFLGIDDFAKSFIGEIKAVTPVTENKISKGGSLFKIKTDSSEFDFKSPVSGNIIKFNDSIFNGLNPLNNSSHSENWICVIEPKILSEEIKTTKIAEEAKEWFKNEIDRLKDFLSTNNSLNSSPVTATLYDGGELLYGLSSTLDKDKLNKFQNEFLAQ
jgi:glycine cleavage system H lipoate-binding protein